MNKDCDSVKKGGTRWWTWMVVGVVAAAMCAGFVFRYELFGSDCVRAVRRIGRENEAGFLKPLRTVKDEVLADTIKAGFDALDSLQCSDAKRYFNSASNLTADSAIRFVLSSLIQECDLESNGVR
ncbi:hypothetical protein GF359_08685 [candidate division WOR-3 bacterium]|uniref:Uncharacterized protein n=1 Tax=candidate division WOR-3 bacterium TaxID=2052148 RepID=A0A9D5QDP8_UNCW3|nr:hypothetical protein [candidate division WOR-3 bacterium]MBD3365276.1 hypothetical protein [candidate division WOR-3 bacterium]